VLEAKSLTKVYPNGTKGLDSLDLQVQPGEVFCLLGANGAGKTTAINLFLNFLEPTSGSCSVNGIDVAKDPLEAKKHLAYLSENVQLYGSFTALDNLDFFARIAGRSDLAEDDYRRLLLSVGLPERACDQRVRNFSKGMRQKLGIAIAIVKDAPAMLLDEPLSGLDPQAAAELVATLRTLREQGKALLLSTHDIFRAKELADRIAIMKNGRKLMERTREELVHEDLEKLYLKYILPQKTTALAEG